MKNRILELWKHKGLIYNFSNMDLKIRYRNSTLGFFWIFLEPLLMLSVLLIVFTNIFETKIENFPLYILLSLIIWNMFSKGTMMGLNSIMSRRGILVQTYFPREIPAISATLTSLYLVFFEMIVFGIFVVALQFAPPITILLLPLFIVLTAIVVLGMSLALSVLNAKFKDVQFVWVIVLQAGFFLTPIFYRIDILPEFMQTILYFSPITQIVIMAQDVTLYGIIPKIEDITITIITSSIVLILGYAIYTKMEKRIVEDI